MSLCFFCSFTCSELLLSSCIIPVQYGKLNLPYCLALIDTLLNCLEEYLTLAPTKIKRSPGSSKRISQPLSANYLNHEDFTPATHPAWTTDEKLDLAGWLVRSVKANQMLNALRASSSGSLRRKKFTSNKQKLTEAVSSNYAHIFPQYW